MKARPNCHAVGSCLFLSEGGENYSRERTIEDVTILLCPKKSGCCCWEKPKALSLFSLSLFRIQNSIKRPQNGQSPDDTIVGELFCDFVQSQQSLCLANQIIIVLQLENNVLYTNYETSNRSSGLMHLVSHVLVVKTTA